ncbi:MAG: hypothetical protein AAF415_12900 [Pseudomonadota bacterium]
MAAKKPNARILRRLKCGGKIWDVGEHPLPEKVLSELRAEPNADELFEEIITTSAAAEKAAAEKAAAEKAAAEKAAAEKAAAGAKTAGS